ncbi:HAUS augmin-like complex subunit 8 [Varanus komodoensis]|uniref:HAUS augmin-like complex subunit 8 n=1 Tax=Varanus komodoensis TaxID=61221 RepID=UPI001CF7BDFC|nr:HAUS augmin-like complex subunit 8 [Varanus komodoensis]
MLATNRNFLPELEVSVIKDKRNRQTTVLTLAKDAPRRNPAVVPPDANDLIEMLDSQTLLLNYASMEMEKTLALLEEQAESNLLVLSEEVEKLQEEIHGNRRRLQRRNDSKISQMLDIQLEVLDPVAELCAHFEEAYRHFATTLDLTRHELPMKALTVGETNAQDLAGLENALAESRSLLSEVLQPHSRENVKALPLLKELTEASQKLDEELSRSFEQVVELSAEVSKEAALHCQQVNEDRLGMEIMEPLYFK